MTKQLLQKAAEEDPKGRHCGFCGNLNNFYDDIGWFYIVDFTSVQDLPPCEMAEKADELSRKPCCLECYDGDPGKLHISVYGAGDR